MAKFRLLSGGLVCLMASACAPTFVQDRMYFDHLAKAPGGMIGSTNTAAADAALASIKKAERKNEYGTKDQLLLGMDLGMATHVAARYKESEMTFRKSDRLAELLFTQSFTSILMSYQLNDYSLPYKGLPYERVMINLINSLNYAATGDWSGALVEARKIREKTCRIQPDVPSGGRPARQLFPVRRTGQGPSLRPSYLLQSLTIEPLYR